MEYPTKQEFSTRPFLCTLSFFPADPADLKNAASRSILFSASFANAGTVGKQLCGLCGYTSTPLSERFQPGKLTKVNPHASFANSLGETRASLVDSSAFALTHISHFGLVFINDKWRFLLIPALIWIISMYLVSLFFIFSKKRSGSISGAIISHAAFNFGMILCIFYFL